MAEEEEEEEGDGYILQTIEVREAVPAEDDLGAGGDRPIRREIQGELWRCRRSWVEARGSSLCSFALWPVSFDHSLISGEDWVIL